MRCPLTVLSLVEFLGGNWENALRRESSLRFVETHGAIFPRRARPSSALAFSVALLALAMAGCGSSNATTSRELVAVDDVTVDVPTSPLDEWVDGAAPIDAGGVANDAGVGGGCAVYTQGALLEATADVNLRAGASTGQAVLQVVPTGAVVSVTATGCPVNGFLPVKLQGVSGWSYASYYRPYTPASPGGDAGASTAFTREDAIRRAQQSVGFAYWWGHGRWRSEGVRAEWVGTCSGSCPNCSFAGTYGADCSGMVAKAWKVPSWNDDVSVDKHPFGTVHFVAANSLWSDVSRSSLMKADALVYNTNGAGHILMYESGDGWGSVYAYECKGCSYGCVRNLRSVGSAYKGIRRAGF